MRVSVAIIMIIAGMRKISGPNIRRHKRVAATPVIAGIWFLELTHCSTKTVVNSAVIAKSIPVELKVSAAPIHPPSTDPTIHAL